jgi:hypothetical protein
MFNPKANRVTTATTDIKMPEDKQLIVSLLSFRPRKSNLNQAKLLDTERNFYYSDTDKLQNIERLIDLVHRNDPKYFYGMINFVAMTIGMRLGPTVAITRAIDNGDQKVLSKLIRNIFTRPDFITNAICYYHNLHPEFDLHNERWKTGWAKRMLPQWAYNAMRDSLMPFKEHTLKNRKMKKKWIKLVNLIHGFQPKPVDDKMSDLYLSIIKNNSGAALKVEVDEETGKVTKGESLRAVLSDTNVSTSAAKEFISINIDKIAIKELLANLTKLNGEDATKLENRLRSVFTSGNDRMIDPMELIMVPAHYNYYSGAMGYPYIHPAILDAIDNILKDHCLFNFESWVNPVIVFDVSGSMFSDNLLKSVKYLALMKNIFYNSKFYIFGDTHVKGDETEWFSQYIELAPNEFVNKFISELHPYIKDKYGVSATDCIGGLEFAIEDSREKGFDTNAVIFITDEHHNSGPDINDYKLSIKKLGVDGRTILINTNPPLSGSSLFEGDDELFRLNDTNGKMLRYASDILYNYDALKERIYNEI